MSMHMTARAKHAVRARRSAPHCAKADVKGAVGQLREVFGVCQQMKHFSADGSRPRACIWDDTQEFGVKLVRARNRVDARRWFQVECTRRLVENCRTKTGSRIERLYRAL